MNYQITKFINRGADQFRANGTKIVTQLHTNLINTPFFISHLKSNIPSNDSKNFFIFSSPLYLVAESADGLRGFCIFKDQKKCTGKIDFLSGL